MSERRLERKLDIYFSGLKKRGPTVQESFAALHTLHYLEEEATKDTIIKAYRHYLMIKSFLEILRVEVPPELDSELEKELSRTGFPLEEG